MKELLPAFLLTTALFGISDYFAAISPTPLSTKRGRYGYCLIPSREVTPEIVKQGDVYFASVWDGKKNHVDCITKGLMLHA